MVNAKTPNKKRKSVGNADGVAKPSQSPKTPKANSPAKTPGKTPKKNVTTPGKPNATPKPQPQQNAKTPKETPNQNQASGKKNNKRANESAAPSSSPKKLKMFGGTAEVQGDKKQKSAQPKKDKKDKSHVKKKGTFFYLKQKVESGDKAAIEELDAKLKVLQSRSELTKTAKRKIKILQKLRAVATGEKIEKPVSESKKQAERKKRDAAKNKGGKPAPKAAAAAPKQEEEEEDSESDYEVETEITPEKIIKTKGEADSEDGEEEESEEEDSDEEDDDDDDDEEEAENPQGKPKAKNETSDLKQISKKTRYIVFVGNLPYDANQQEISEHFKKAGEIRHVRIPTDKKTNKPRGFAYVEFNEEVSYQKALSMHHTTLKGRRINVLYTQGGKKKGQEKKNEVKAKNLKLQAMRKQGQLAGSVKENQKRSARRAKKNKPVNGAD